MAAKDFFTGDATPWEKQQIQTPDSDSDTDSEPDLPMPSELSQILTSIAEDINCLFRLSVSIRNPAPHDRFKQTSLTDTSHFEPFDVQHVRSKFSAAPEGVVERLGKAISRRRQYFRYRELHHQKMASGLETEGDDGLQSTIASSIPRHLKTDLETLEPLSLDKDDDDNRRSQTSFATSVANTERSKLPALPEAAQEGPFECPLCFMMVSITTRRLWK